MPEFDEALIFARYLDQAAEGFFRFLLGSGYAEIVARAYCSTNNSYSFENVIFAERDNKIVGMASGFTGKQHRRFTRQPLRNVAGCHSFRMRVISTLFAPMLRIIDTIEDDDFYLLAIATDKAARGHGIGSALLDTMEERAISCDSERLVLDVSARNTGARRLYERRGMKVGSFWPKRLHLPVIRFLRMLKTF
jgi:ribosomal protein S18 acetylase RimI-like enzyme